MDTGLHSLVAVARFHQLPADLEQLAHQFGEPGKPLSDTNLLQAAKALTLKVKLVAPKLSAIGNQILPAVAKAKDGTYFVLARVAEPKSEEAEPQDSRLLV